MSLKAEKLLVIGGGQAAAECVASLRMGGFGGSITLVSADPYLPYGLPPLSKAYLTGTASLDDIVIRPASTYADHNIVVRCGVRAEMIDRSAHKVLLADGDWLNYDRLVIATGGRPRALPAAMAAAGADVHYLRTVADADALRSRLSPGSRIVVVGGGYLGLEVAAAARQLGVSVTVVETMSRLLARVTSAPVSKFFLRLHQARGVDIRLGTSVVKVTAAADGEPTRVEISTGELLPAEAVLVSIGLIPAVGLAEAAGLDVADGIIVDEYCRTSDPDIFAAGDCTRHPCFENGGRRRLESLANANEQAATVAGSVTGRPMPYTSTPWFWSEQYDVTLRSAGLSHPSDDLVIRGSTKPGRSFSVFYLREGQVRAADVVSDTRGFALAKRLVSQRSSVDAALLGDPTTSLKELTTRSTGHGSEPVAALS